MNRTAFSPFTTIALDDLEDVTGGDNNICIGNCKKATQQASSTTTTTQTGGVQTHVPITVSPLPPGEAT
jgi:hypothetical protein